jgi:tight adherence protein C
LPTEVSQTHQRLIHAGFRDAIDVNYYFGVRILTAAIGFVGVALSIGFDNPALLIGITVLGFLLPWFILRRMIRDRQNRIRLALPDALDLTVISVEAGLSLDHAMLRVGEDLSYAHPDLSDELFLVNREMRAGYSWDEALCNLSERTGVDEIKASMDAFVQAGPLGVVRVLRAYSNSLRIERQRWARAQAIRAAIKLVPALVLFIVPPVLIATLGPAIIQGIRSSGPR